MVTSGERRDRRPAILAGALGAPHLTAGEKIVLVGAATLKAQYIDGNLRFGSKAMNELGYFALHHDYLAERLSISAKSVKDHLRKLADKNALSMANPATFGRPVTWQALDIRGTKILRLESDEIGTPYELARWAVWRTKQGPPTCSAPDHPDHDGGYASTDSRWVTENGAIEDERPRRSA